MRYNGITESTRVDIMEVVWGIIEENQTYLIAKRGKGVHENIWEFPGGKIEHNETREEAVVREIKEELHLDVEVLEHVLSVVDHREAMDIHVHAYRCRKIGGSLELHAHHEVRYVSYQELYDYTFEPSDYAILDALGKHKASLATNKDFS